MPRPGGATVLRTLVLCFLFVGSRFPFIGLTAVVCGLCGVCVAWQGAYYFFFARLGSSTCQLLTRSRMKCSISLEAESWRLTHSTRKSCQRDGSIVRLIFAFIGTDIPLRVPIAKLH